MHHENSSDGGYEHIKPTVFEEILGLKNSTILIAIFHFFIITVSLILYILMAYRNVKAQKINYRFSHLRLFHVNFLFLVALIFVDIFQVFSNSLENNPGIVISASFLIVGFYYGVPENFVLSLCLIQSILLVFTRCEKKINFLGIHFRGDLWTFLFSIILTCLQYSQDWILEFEVGKTTVSINRYRFFLHTISLILALSWLLSVKLSRPAKNAKKTSKKSKKYKNSKLTKICFFINIFLTTTVSLLSDLIYMICGLLYNGQVQYTTTTSFGTQIVLVIWIWSIFLGEKRRIRGWIWRSERATSKVDLAPNLPPTNQ